MNRYSLRKDPKYDTHWIALPNNGGEVGDMADITCELNRLIGNYEVAVDERDAAIAERDEARNLLESSKAARKSLNDACDSLQVEVRELKEQRDEARREAERWRDCFKTGMSLQPKAPSQIFPWENNQND
jgi:hypothetical protein